MPRHRLAHPHAWALVAFLLLAGCGTKDKLATDAIGYVPNVDNRLAEVDWNTAELVNIELTEWKYKPNTLTFTRGKPYRLHLENTGIEPHDLSSPDFFKAVIVGKLVGPKGTVDKPHVISIGLNDGETRDVYFVPVRAGTYYFECEEPLHARFGMRGKAVIE